VGWHSLNKPNMEKVCKIRPFLPVYLDFLILARGGYIQFKPFVVTLRFNTQKEGNIHPKKAIHEREYK